MVIKHKPFVHIHCTYMYGKYLLHCWLKKQKSITKNSEGWGALNFFGAPSGWGQEIEFNI